MNKQIKNWVEKSEDLKKIRRDLAETSKEMNIALAQIYKNPSPNHFPTLACSQQFQNNMLLVWDCYVNLFSCFQLQASHNILVEIHPQPAFG